MNMFKKLFVKYLIVILIAFLFDCLFSEISNAIISNLLENILFAIILICPHFLISSVRFNKWLFIVLYLFFSISVCIETIYYNLYETTFSSSLIFVILDSNAQESMEFIGFYITKEIAFLLISVLIAVVIILLKLKPTFVEYFSISLFNSPSSSFVCLLKRGTIT